jgi:polyphosphate kinase
VEQQYTLYNDELMPALEKHGIAYRLARRAQRGAAPLGEEYFEREVRPLLVPVGLDPAHPFPAGGQQVAELHRAAGGKDAFGRENEIAIVKVPRVLPRFIRMPAKVGGKMLFVSLSSVIRAHLHELFPGPRGGPVLAVPRHPAFRPGRGRRRRAQPAHRAAPGAGAPPLRQAVRLEVSAGCSEHLATSCSSSSTCRSRRCTACTAR